MLLRREGWMINQKKTRRIYSELGMQLRNKTPKRRVKAKLREDRTEAIGPNDIWAMDARQAMQSIAERGLHGGSACERSVDQDVERFG